jgi:hypothetical protein
MGLKWNLWKLLSWQGKVILEEDAKKIRKRQAYNILPMEEDGISNPFSYFPEVATPQSCSIHFLARFVSAW